ncbi:hypothetical protein [Streptomyces sp. NPDC056661]|uniref:hypothetical protein n=1 Tax=Streptomyces sp. NPDC056661 TaxID=3345898 RepID=UPI0036B22031
MGFETLAHAMAEHLAQADAQVAAQFAPRWEVGQAIDLISADPGLSGQQLRQLAEALAGHDVPQLQCALIRKGEEDMALAMPITSQESFFYQLDEALRAPGDVPAGVIAEGVRLLGEVGDDVAQLGSFLLALAGAKTLARHLPAKQLKALVATLQERHRAGLKAGEFDELDYPYGTIDPTLELARCLAAAGDESAAEAALDVRAGYQLGYMNIEEVNEACAIVSAWDRGRQKAAWQRFTTWAAEEEDRPYGFAQCRAVWFVATCAYPFGHLSHAALGDLIPELGAEALGRVTAEPTVPEALRKAALDRLVFLIATMSFNDCYSFGNAVHGLASAANLLSVAQREKVIAQARAWVAWLMTVGKGDTSPIMTTAFSWARVDPIVLAPARQHLINLADQGQDGIFGYDGWEQLFNADEVAAKLKELHPELESTTSP